MIRMEKSKYLLITSIISVLWSQSEQLIFSDIALDIQNTYSLRTTVIVVNMDDYNNDSFLLQPAKTFSNYNQLSIMISYEKFEEAINYYYERPRPFIMIIIKTLKDFTYLVNITKNLKLNKYWTFVVFLNEANDNAMGICLNPKKNYLNLMYNSRIFVLCYKKNESVNLIYEWYSLHGNETRVVPLVYWLGKGKLFILDESSLFERRKDLDGITLRVTDLKKYSNDELSNVSVGGLFQDVLELIATESNFKLSYQKPESSYGILNGSESAWSGILGRLLRNETDIGLGEVAQTRVRQEALDFTIPVITSYLSYYYKNSKMDWYLPWSIFYKPFGPNAAVIMTIIFITAPLMMGYMKFQKRQYYNNLKENSFYKIIQECYLDCWGILCKIQIADTAEALSLQIAYTSLYILSFFITSMYAAILMSRLTIFKPKIIFNSLEEFIDDGSYKITVMKDSTYMNRLYNEDSELTRKLKPLLTNPNNLEESVTGAVDQVCKNSRLVYLMDDWGVRVNIPSNCELVPFDKEYLVNMGFVFQKHSPYVGLFNYYIQKFGDHGVILNLKNRYYKKDQIIKLNYESVTLISIVPIYFILVFGIWFSFLILILEKIYFKLTLKEHEFLKSKTNYWKPLIRSVN